MRNGDIYMARKAMRNMDELFSLNIEARDLLCQVVAEWSSDPMSVQCFDLRTVERAKYVVARIKQLDPLAKGK